MKVTLNIYREGSRWYVGDDNGFSKDENELVASITEMIESLIGKAEGATLVASTEPIDGALHLTLVDPDVDGGVEYSIETPAGELIGWLCRVFWHYFDSAPEQLYVTIAAVP